MAEAIDQKDIQTVNDRLRAAAVPVRVRQNNRHLVLRATLPPKLGESHPKQRDLSLGIPATRSGLRRAEKAAKALEVELNEGRFDWAKYDRTRPVEPETETVSQLVERFKPFKMRRRQGKRDCSEQTWQDYWLTVYERLPQDEPLNAATLSALLLSTDQDGWTRRQYVQKLKALCDFAGVKFDFGAYPVKYAPEPRDIPEEKLIIESWAMMPAGAWRWIYGIVATFGARPHEVFFCEMVDQDVLQIYKGKTGPRISVAIRPEWVELWELQNKPVLPVVAPVKREDFKACGAAVGQQFRRSGVPFDPYVLRHAWAIRASVVEKLPLSTSAAFMGHSVDVHTKVYHEWLKDETNLAVYRKIVRGLLS